MKKVNLLVMSLVSAAALSFTSCSSDSDFSGENAGKGNVNEFYMTLSVQTPKANGTRTALKNDFAATADESAITSGTFYLVDENGNVAFKKTLDESEWAGLNFENAGTTGSKTLNIPVENVVAGATYKVYFLANTVDETPWSSTVTANNKFAQPFATNKSFAMFNQNDATVNGTAYTVVFTDANKQEDNAATVKYNGSESAIKLERIVARIDEPTSNANDIKAYNKADATDAEKNAMADAIAKVESLKLTGYAISNLSNKSYLMQKWNEKVLTIPTGITYYQSKSEFGTATKLENAAFFNAVTEGSTNKDYVFENNSTENASAMYFEYTVTLKENAGTKKDFEDGTFYRYNNVIYTSFQDIFAAYKDVQGLFDGKSATKLAEELTAAKNDADAEAKLDAFRQAYDIEVFNEGKTYYKQAIQDKYIGYANAIQRNSVYKLTVNNIFNVGAQVPNGTPDKNGLFYLDVTVSVNPWVLNEQSVDLK